MSYSPEREIPASGMSNADMAGLPLPDSDDDELLEIPIYSASWTLSSAKPGNGVDQLLDRNSETFWQSDGTQPHTVTIQFFRKTKVSDVWLLFNYKSDESYTPQQVSIRIGTGYFDLQEIQVVDLREPDGWVRVPLALRPTEGTRSDQRQECVSIRDKSFGGAFDFIRTFTLQIAIICNHQNGRDTHLRGVRLYAPKEERKLTLAEVVKSSRHSEKIDRGIPFLTAEMASMALIR